MMPESIAKLLDDGAGWVAAAIGAVWVVVREAFLWAKGRDEYKRERKTDWEEFGQEGLRELWKTLQAQVGILESDLDETRARFRKLEADLVETRDRCRRLEDELVKTRERCRKLEDWARDLEAENKRLKRQLDTYEGEQ